MSVIINVTRNSMAEVWEKDLAKGIFGYIINISFHELILVYIKNDL